jgi:hypothetical protein
VQREDYHFGIGIDTALPAPRSAIQITSPAGSTAVGVLSPSLSTVTLALSPLTVITGDLAAAILSNEQLAIDCAHAIRPFYGLIHPDVDRSSGVAGSVQRDSVEIVREHIVHIQRTVQKGDPVNAVERDLPGRVRQS